VSIEWSKPYAVDITPVLSGIEYQKEIADNARAAQFDDLNTSQRQPNKKLTYDIMNKIVLDAPEMFASRSHAMASKDKEAVKSGLPLRPKASNNKQDLARNSTAVSERYRFTFLN
jgi:hypothetical protein